MTKRCTTFDTLLDEHRVLVADGAMGTTLFSLGLEGGGCPELLNVVQPDLVEKVHRAFIDAGADIVLTNTFGGNARRLALHDLQDRVVELNTAAVERARLAVEQADRPVAIAGSIGPTGDLFEPLGPLSHAAGVEVFSEQAAALVEAGADVLWIETISSWEELNAAVEAASAFDIPVAATLSFDTNGRTMMGISGSEVGAWWEGRALKPAAMGANCGIGPGDAVSAVLDITAAAPGVAGITKANCGMPLYDTDRLVYPVGPERMAEYVDLAVRSGARIIGACCGSTPDHVAAIREAVDAGVTGERPDHTEIEIRLDATPLAAAPAARRNRRRSAS
ncbi:MAG TPA: betaine--homocysteine S-methyltransferase [Acidimicrobiia bacterium]|nr:betaine--homocysteine S-methyltransferase [Acidimicrobiia bacterium]